MPNYEKMYFTLLHATEKAINELIAAQQTCEELYILSSQEEQKNQPKFIEINHEKQE